MKKTKLTGFTLIEIVVVIFIIALIAGFSFLAVGQAADRRYLSQAENFLTWLEQLSDQAMLENTAYGIMIHETSVEALVYYQYRWQQLARPAPYVFRDRAGLAYNGDPIANESEALSIEVSAEKLPDFVMLPDGDIEPGLELILRFDNFDSSFTYQWDDQERALQLERRRL